MPDDFRRSSGPPRSRTAAPPPQARQSQRPTGSALPADVGHALQSVSRAARSFSLYDPHNDAVKLLIGDYKEKMAAVMRNAPVEVEVLPFEMTYRGEVVYREEDRERSLAFRLFRDGVRKVKFEEEMTWNDLVTLLEVLSVRCNTVRQQEEDLVTLLRKANFRGIVIESVEGYLPDEEKPEHAALAQAVSGTSDEAHDPPEDWDQPFPDLGQQTKVVYQDIDDDELAALRAEESNDGLAGQAVRAVTEVLQVAYGLKDTKFRDDVMLFLDEVQEFLIVERNLPALGALAGTYQRIFGEGQALPVLTEERSFARLLRAVPEDSDHIPAALGPLLALVPGDHVDRALTMLELGPKGARRAALLSIVRSGAANNPSIVADRLAMSPSALARDLFQILGETAPDRRVDAAFGLLGQPDEAFQLELVEVIATGARGVRLARGLQTLMASPHEQVRVKAAEALGSIGGARAVPLLAEHAKRLAAAETSTMELDAIGAAMALASVDDAKLVFAEWTRSATGLRNLFARLTKDAPGDKTLMYVAVAGLELCPGKESEDTIAAVLSRASGELEFRCREALDRRRGGGHD